MSFLLEMFERMQRFYLNRETQPWWPSDPLEVIVGAVLVQGTKWANVANVLETLKNVGLLDFQQLLQLDVQDLEQRIRSVGFQQRKAPALKGILEFLQKQFDGDLDRFFSQDSQDILKQLLSVKGIGPQTAQNILQYGGNRNLYAVDKFTFRIFLRHGLIDRRAKTEQVQRLIADGLQITGDFPCEKELLSFNEFQALLVRIGRDFCGKTETNCRECPLEPLLPMDGPHDVSFEAPIAVTPEREKLPMPGPAVPSYRPPQPPPPESPPVELSEQEAKVFSCVETDGTPIDAVIVQSGLPTGQVLATLFALEMKKLVKRREGNMVARM